MVTLAQGIPGMVVGEGHVVGAEGGVVARVLVGKEHVQGGVMDAGGEVRWLKERVLGVVVRVRVNRLEGVIAVAGEDVGGGPQDGFQSDAGGDARGDIRGAGAHEIIVGRLVETLAEFGADQDIGVFVIGGQRLRPRGRILPRPMPPRHAAWAAAKHCRRRTSAWRRPIP